jgi:hypothetical protein
VDRCPHYRKVFGSALATEPAVELSGGQTFDLDYRFVALGALLPDLVDKPLAWFLFPQALPDDHVYGHALLFPASLIAAGLLISARFQDSRLLAMGLGNGSGMPHAPICGPRFNLPAYLVLASPRHGVS